MPVGPWLRRILLLVSVAAVVLSVSILRELASVFQLGIRSAVVESELVSGSLVRQLAFGSSSEPALSIAENAASDRVQRTMMDAQSVTLSVLHVAIYDANGVILAHTLPQQVGAVVGPMPPLPETADTVEALVHLWKIWRNPTDFATDVPLVSPDGAPVAVIRVIVGGPFLLHEVEAAFVRGLPSVVFLILFAVGAGVFGARTTSKRIRRLEEGVVALREGRFDASIPKSGWDEFGRLAKELQLLGRRFQDEAGTGGVQRAADLLGDGILVLDDRDQVVLSNRIAWDRLQTAGILPGATLREVVGVDHPLQGLIERLRSGQERSLTIPLEANGAGDAVAVAHRIEQEDAAGGVLIEIKAAQAQADLHNLVDRSTAYRRLGEMAAGVAHEIRGPLQGLEFDLDQLGASLEQPERSHALVRDLQEKMQRLERAVTGFLKVARVRPSKMEAVSACELLQSARDAMQADALLHGLEIRLKQPDAEVFVWGDREALQRALENLVSNALEALPSATGLVELSCGVEGGIAEIKVSDGGPGIAPDRREKVFDLYFTTKSEGTGVGLPVVRQTVELHDGEIRLDTSTDSGTSITLLLPLATSVQT